MTRLKRACAALSLLCLVLGLVACSSKEPGSSNEDLLGVADGSARGQLVRKTSDGSTDVVLTLKTGAKLEVYKDGLIETTTLAIERPKEERAQVLAARLKSHRDALASAPYVLTPHGTEFTKEARLTLPIAKEKQGARLAVAWLEDEDDRVWKFLDAPEVDGDRAHVMLKHFSVVMLVDLDYAELEGLPEPCSSPELDCGVPDDEPSADADVARDGGSDGSTLPASSFVTLVSALATDTSAPIATPHTIVFLHALTGVPLEPPTQVTTERTTGRFELPQGAVGLAVSAYVHGQGPPNGSSSTFDTVVLDFDATKDPLLRIMSTGTASVEGLTAGYTPRPDRARLAGRVLVTNNGRPVAAVGCAKLYLDGATDLAVDSDQRYVNNGGLATPTAMLSQTTVGRGAFHFGNIAKGVHTLQVSVDNGQSFIASKTFYVPFSRAEAVSDYKDMLVQLAVEIEGPNPTPAGCLN